MGRRESVLHTTGSGKAEAVIRAMVDQLVHDFHPLKIILFGSRAAGRAHPWSDVDFLVIVKEAPDKRGAAIQMRRALARFPLPKDIIVATPGEIEERGSVVGSILLPALREGRLLYGSD